MNILDTIGKEQMKDDVTPFNVGDTVTAGQTVCVLEAMKMENEIPAPKAGKVLQIVAAKGASVNAGDALVVLG